MRVLKLLASLHVGLLLLLGFSEVGRVVEMPHHRDELATPPSSGRDWFHAIKPYCNPVEAGVTIQRRPPPQDRDGWGYAAACHALAGKIDRADEILAGIADAGDRAQAAGIVFQVGHPVADAGDDDAAGPIMRLVIQHLPENWPAYYMALYHAGISEYNMGDFSLAQEHLQRFLEIYGRNDGWRGNALRVLAKIENAEGGKVFSGHGRIE